MSQNNKIILDIVKIKNLPPLPEASIKIITAVNDPDVSVDHLVNVLTQSPVLTARLLGLANSAFFGRSGQINDLRVAIIQVLGLNLVKSLALSIVLNTELDTTKCKLFDAGFFWSHALVTACLAQKLSRHIEDKLMTQSTVYTSGLLLNIGLLAAIYILPSQVNDVFDQTDKKEGSVSKQMFESLGKTQYELGGILLERWQLPEIYQTVVKQFRQSGFDGKEKKLVELLELSHWVGAYIVTEKDEQMPEFSELLNKLTLSKEILENCIAEMVSDKDKVTEMAKLISG